MIREIFTPPDYSEKKNFINPKLSIWSVLLYLHRKPILEAVLESTKVMKGYLLDVGSGIKPYRELFNIEFYFGIDIKYSVHSHINNVDVLYDGFKFPFKNKSFDSILCTEVLEHCKNPNNIIGECYRVLKEDGIALITVPFFIHHHEEPNDYYRFTYYGLKNMAKENNFEILWLKPRGGKITTLIAALYLIISSSLSRRPFIDIVYLLLFPITYLLLKFESNDNKPTISLGWQLLIKKNG